MNERWAGAARGAQSRTERRGGPTGSRGSREPGGACLRVGAPPQSPRFPGRPAPGPGDAAAPPGRPERADQDEGGADAGPREPAARGGLALGSPQSGFRGSGRVPGTGVRAARPPPGPPPRARRAPPGSGAGSPAPRCARPPSPRRGPPRGRRLGVGSAGDAAKAGDPGGSSGRGGPGAAGRGGGGRGARGLTRARAPLLRGQVRGSRGPQTGGGWRDGPLNPLPRLRGGAPPPGDGGCALRGGGGLEIPGSHPARPCPAPPPSPDPPCTPRSPGPRPGSGRPRLPPDKGAAAPAPGRGGRGGGERRTDKGLLSGAASGSRARVSGLGGGRSPPSPAGGEPLSRWEGRRGERNGASSLPPALLGLRGPGLLRPGLLASRPPRGPRAVHSFLGGPGAPEAGRLASSPGPGPEGRSAHPETPRGPSLVLGSGPRGVWAGLFLRRGGLQWGGLLLGGQLLVL